MPAPATARTQADGFFAFLHRQADLRGGAVDHDLRRGPDRDPDPSGRRVPGSGAAIGGGAHGVPGRQPQGHRRDRRHPAGGGHQRRRGHDVPQVGGRLRRRAADDRHLPPGHRPGRGRGEGAEPGGAGAGAPARGRAPAGGDHAEAVADVPDGGAPDLAGRQVRHPVPAQLRAPARQGCAGAHPRGRRRADLRRRRLRHACLARPGQGGRARPDRQRRGARDA